MIGFERSDDYQPLFWVGGRPVHVTMLLVGVHVLALVVSSLLHGLVGWSPQFAMLFSASAVLHGEVWRLVTYPFAHDLSLGFAFSMFILAFIGREVERFFGRTMFIWLYTGLVLTGSLTLLALHYLPNADAGDAQWLDGGNLVLFGVFIAFAILYPNMQVYFWIPSVWIVYTLLGIGTLACFANHAWHLMTTFWISVAFAYFYTQYARVGSEAFGPLANWRAYLPRRTVRRELPPQPRSRRVVDVPAHVSKMSGGVSPVASSERGDNVHESIDPLLDKISKHGLASLTHSERATLERARVSLLRKERGG